MFDSRSYASSSFQEQFEMLQIAQPATEAEVATQHLLEHKGGDKPNTPSRPPLLHLSSPTHPTPDPGHPRHKCQEKHRHCGNAMCS
jgi:hypothetical protein